ncbi:hypothetical protein L0222_31050 [bacterium]|nr:hypothetical protein [bacterium]
MSSTTKSTQAIIDHAKKHLSVSADKIAVDDIPIEALPPYMEVYYVEKEGSYGNIYFHYVVINGELFSSADKDSFERLLKKERYLEKKSLTVDQLIILFRMLKVRMRDTEVVGIEDLKPGGRLEQEAEKITPPALTETKNGVDVAFWTTSLRHEPEKWTFTISPDYTVTYTNERLQPGS